MPRIPNHLEEVFGTSGSSPTDRNSTKAESTTGSGSSNGASYPSASQHDIGVPSSASGKEASKTARPGATVFNKLKKVFERPRQRGAPSKGSSQGADPEQSVRAPPLDERVDSAGLDSIEENIRAWEASLDTSTSDQTLLGPGVLEAHHLGRDSAQSVTRADPFAAGFSGPVPLSSLSPGFQDFVLRTIGNEVLREFRYKGAGVSGELVGSSKMSAAKQVSVTFDDVREKNLKQLRKLNQVLFPVRYEETFYTDVLSSGEYAKLGKCPRSVFFVSMSCGFVQISHGFSASPDPAFSSDAGESRSRPLNHQYASEVPLDRQHLKEKNSTLSSCRLLETSESIQLTYVTGVAYQCKI
jgi:hypothetical protein